LKGTDGKEGTAYRKRLKNRHGEETSSKKEGTTEKGKEKKKKSSIVTKDSGGEGKGSKEKVKGRQCGPTIDIKDRGNESVVFKKAPKKPTSGGVKKGQRGNAKRGYLLRALAQGRKD